MMRKLPLNLVNKQISYPHLIQTFDWYLDKMEAEKEKPAPAASATSNPRRPILQSLEDFENEQHDLETLKASESIGHVAATPGTKQEIASLQAEIEELEAGRLAKKGYIKAERDKLEAERLARKAALQAERKQLEVERKAKKEILQAERQLLEEEELAVEQRAFEAVKELGAVNWVGKLLGR